jgi:hypothetical protein
MDGGDENEQIGIRCGVYEQCALPVGALVSCKGILALAETNNEDFGVFVQVAMIEELESADSEALHWMTTLAILLGTENQDVRSESHKSSMG